jgi:ATP-dependent Clp protease adaptor protein ClpS
MGKHEADTVEQVEGEVREESEEPPLYSVLLHNDDYTTMAFVVEILMYVFNKSVEDATRIMLNVHRKGKGLCGTYPFEVAETKVDTVETLARENGFPLRCSMERE